LVSDQTDCIGNDAGVSALFSPSASNAAKWSNAASALEYGSCALEPTMPLGHLDPFQGRFMIGPRALIKRGDAMLEEMGAATTTQREGPAGHAQSRGGPLAESPITRRSVALIGACLIATATAVVGTGPVRAHATGTAAQIGKVVVIVEENEPYGSIVGNSQAPYLNQLIANWELFTNYTAVASGSTPDYLAMTSGLTSSLSPPSPNIFQAIDRTGGALTWKEFMESMPGNCAQGNYANIPGTNVPFYTASHDPDYEYRATSTCSTNDVPMTSGTFNPASLPALSYVVPNQCDDMHTLPGSGQACPAYFGSNGGTSLIGMGDNWLASVVPTLLAQPGVTVVITWDEGSLNTTPSEHVVALMAGAGVTAGSTDGTAYTHYGLEAGLYNYFGLGTAPNNGATATPLPIPSPAPPPPPTISSFTPASGWPGTSVTVAGSGLAGTTAVSFNGTAAAFTVTSGAQLTATVPAGAVTGPISVTTAGGSTTSTSSFTVTSQPAPSITGVSPSSAAVGSSVTITGSALTGASAVTFDNTAAAFTVVSDSTITATVPSGALSGSISVTTPFGGASSPAPFSVIPKISSFSPSSGKTGTTVTITGSAFTGATLVTFNGTPAPFTVNSYGQITATVPAGATSGRIAVTTPSGVGTSSASFSVRGHH
jgi:IPT/TIG domain